MAFWMLEMWMELRVLYCSGELKFMSKIRR